MSAELDEALAKAIKDPLCPTQFSPILMEAKRKLRKLEAENIKVSCHCAALIQALRDLGEPDEAIAAIAHQQSPNQEK